MKSLYFSIIVILLLLTSCLYGINKKTSEICTINWFCNWDSLESKYSIRNLNNSNFIEKLREFNQMTFSTKVIYLKEFPEELIGISDDHYAIRYVHNPLISSQVLDGLSPQLPENEKFRIKVRMDSIFKSFNCSKE